MALGQGSLPDAYFDALILVVGAVRAARWNENAARWEAQNHRNR